MLTNTLEIIKNNSLIIILITVIMCLIKYSWCTMYYDVKINTIWNTYSVESSNIKPKDHGSAIETLKKIKNLLKNQDSYFYVTAKDPNRELLDAAQKIKDNYLEKTSKLNWLVKKLFGKEGTVNALYDEIFEIAANNATAKRPQKLGYLPLQDRGRFNELPKELVQEIVKYLPVKDSGRFAEVNHTAESLVMIEKAKDFGYEGSSADEAIKYLHQLHADYYDFCQKQMYQYNKTNKERGCYIPGLSELPAFPNVDAAVSLQVIREWDKESNFYAFLSLCGFFNINRDHHIIDIYAYPTLLKFIIKQANRNLKSNNSDPVIRKQYAQILTQAVFYNSYETVKFLLERNFNPNLNFRAWGGPPLGVAVRNGRKDIATLLLQHKADINALNNHRITPLAVAVEADNKEMVQFLILHGADTAQALSFARYLKNSEMVNLLLDAQK